LGIVLQCAHDCGTYGTQSPYYEWKMQHLRQHLVLLNWQQVAADSQVMMH
jgi:hypothetical protein